MENYALTMKGRFVTEKVLNIPIWTLNDIGRFIYVISLDRYFIGAQTAVIDDDGWASVGLYNESIKNKHIDWDINLEYLDDNKISGRNIPIVYDETNTNIQRAIDLIYVNILHLVTGDLLDSGSIISRHIGFEANNIKIDNSLGYFTPLVPPTDLTIQNVLDELYLRTAEDLKLSKNTNFGNLFNLNITSLESSLISLEKYLNTFPSKHIIVNDPIKSSPLALQYCIDALYGLITSSKFISLNDTPNNYGLQNQFLITNGNEITYADIYADIINVQYPSSVPTTVQAAFNSIRIELDNIELGAAFDPLTRDITQINASNVIYDNSEGVLNLSNVDDTLDYLLINSYTLSKPPKAIDIPCSGIGSTTNTQSALEHLQEYLNQAIGLIPSCLKASDIYYNSVKDQTNVDSALDYLFLNDAKILALEDCCTKNTSKLNKQKIYFSSYKVESNFNPCGGFPISLSFDFNNWYTDYKLNFNPDVGDNFIVVPIIQTNSLVITNVYQKSKCASWSNPDPEDPLYPGTCSGGAYLTPMYSTWPPKFPNAKWDEAESGTLGEYPYIYYNSGPVEYLDDVKKWTFAIKVGSRSFGYGKRDFSKTDSAKELEPDRSYSTGGDISYTILFFGFGTDVNSLVKVLDTYCVVPCLYPTTGGTRSDPVPFDLKIEFVGTGIGTVTGIGAVAGVSITCSNTASYNFAIGTVIYLTAVATAPSTFSSWVGGDIITSNKCTVTMNGDKTVKVTFNEAEIVVTFYVTLGGKVTTTNGINCVGVQNGKYCSYTYDGNTAIDITVTADSGYDFTNVTVDGQFVNYFPNENPSTYEGYKPTKSVTFAIIFEAIAATYLLEFLISVGGCGSVITDDGYIDYINCDSTGDHMTRSHSYAPNVPIIINVAPASGYYFKSVTLEGVPFPDWDTSILRYTMPSLDQEMTITLNFGLVGDTGKTLSFDYNLPVAINTITSSDGNIDCGPAIGHAQCSYNYEAGTSISLTINVTEGYKFNGAEFGGEPLVPPWVPNDLAYTIEMPNYDLNITLLFIIDSSGLTLTINKSPAAGGTVTTSDNKINCDITKLACSTIYTTAGWVTISINPSNGYEVTNIKINDVNTPASTSIFVYVDINTTIDITFGITSSYSLRVEIKGGGTGYVSVSDGSIGNCRTSDTCTYLLTDNKTITVVPDSYSEFIHATLNNIPNNGWNEGQVLHPYTWPLNIFKDYTSVQVYFERIFYINVTKDPLDKGSIASTDGKFSCLTDCSSIRPWYKANSTNIIFYINSISGYNFKIDNSTLNYTDFAVTIPTLIEDKTYFIEYFPV